MPSHVHFDRHALWSSEKKEADASEQDLNSRRIIDPEYYSISRITHSFKGYTASECNRILKRKGEFLAATKVTTMPFEIARDGIVF